MDTTKGLPWQQQHSSIWDYSKPGSPARGPILRSSKVPEIAGTRLELKRPARFLTNWESHIKTSIGGIPAMQAKLALVDPALTLTCR